MWRASGNTCYLSEGVGLEDCEDEQVNPSEHLDADDDEASPFETGHSTRVLIAGVPPASLHLLVRRLKERPEGGKLRYLVSVKPQRVNAVRRAPPPDASFGGAAAPLVDVRRPPPQVVPARAGAPRSEMRLFMLIRCKK